MSTWLKRFGLHVAAAIGATSIFFAAAAVGASQAGSPSAPTPAAELHTRGPLVSPSPNQPRRTPASATAAGPAARPTPDKVVPERSLSGTILDILPDGLRVLGSGGREWRVAPAPGALIRLNGKTTPLDALHAGDAVVILGQAQPRDGPQLRFLAHAITARRK